MESTITDIANSFKQYGYIKDNQIFLNEFLHFPSRKIGEVRESEEQAINYFHLRFTSFVDKVEKIFQDIDAAENKGSFLQKLLHFKELVGSYDALGDFASIHHKLVQKEEELHEQIAINRVKNLDQKKVLLEELAPLSENKDWVNTAERIKDLRNRWIKIGAVDKSVENEVETQFKLLSDVFYEGRRKFYDELNAANAQKIEKYKELFAKALEVAAWQDMRKASFELKQIAQDWKNVGRVPARDLKTLYQDFKTLNKTFSQKYKRSLSQANNSEFASKIPQYMALYDQLNTIKKEMPYGGEERVKYLQTEWKKVGFIKDEDFKKMNNNFQADCARLLDLYFLNKMCWKRNSNFQRLPAKDLLKLKIELLKEIIEKDENLVINFESSYFKAPINSQQSEFDKVFGAKLAGQKKRLIVKKLLLEQFENDIKKLL